MPMSHVPQPPHRALYGQKWPLFPCKSLKCRKLVWSDPKRRSRCIFDSMAAPHRHSSNCHHTPLIRYPTACCILALLVAASARSDPMPPTLRIVRPAPGSIITTNSLVLEVEPETPDDTILAVEMRATYFTAGYEPGSASNYYQYTADTLLHIDSTPPFQWIWDISGVQDQYHHRMSVSFVAHARNGRTARARTSDFVIDRNPNTAPKKRVSAAFGHHLLDMKLDPQFPVERIRNGDNTVAFQVAWTHDTVYALFLVDDASIVPAEDTLPDGSKRWWNGDAMELFFDTRDSRSPLFDTCMFQVVISAEGEGAGGYESFALKRYRFPIAIRRRDYPQGYCLLCGVAWRDMRVAEPRAGMTLGFEVTNVDRDKAGGLFTHGTLSGLHLGNHHNASEWSELVLGPAPTSTASPGTLVAGIIVVLGAAGLLAYRRLRAQRPSPDDGADGIRSTATSEPGPLTRAIMELVEQEYANENLNLQYVATRLHKNPKYLSTLFKKEAGMGFAAYLNEIRLKKADHLLRTTDRSISHIGLEVGYSSYKYFSAVYRKHYGKSPSDARKQL
ncbi:MAG: helix-turn-helix domain-containing protein [Chitinivibrionales bacterium]|nr:helix-turn-helix domain-containing protein [Chitinivibrionales bacterium]